MLTIICWVFYGSSPCTSRPWTPGLSGRGQPAHKPDTNRTVDWSMRVCSCCSRRALGIRALKDWTQRTDVGPWCSLEQKRCSSRQSLSWFRGSRSWTFCHSAQTWVYLFWPPLFLHYCCQRPRNSTPVKPCAWSLFSCFCLISSSGSTRWRISHNNFPWPCWRKRHRNRHSLLCFWCTPSSRLKWMPWRDTWCRRQSGETIEPHPSSLMAVPRCRRSSTCRERTRWEQSSPEEYRRFFS